MTTRKTVNHGSARNGEPSETPVLERLAAINGSLAEGIDRTGLAWLKNLCALQEETLRFVNRRLERDTEIVEEYRQSKNVADRLAIQQKWLASLGQDFLQEGFQLGKVMQDIMTNSVAELAEVAASTSWKSASAGHAATQAGVR